MMTEKESKCQSPECAFNGVSETIKYVRADIETIKRAQERFETKQDNINDAISNHKAILALIENIKDNQEKVDERITRLEMGVRDNHGIIFKQLNELEKEKATKDEVKEGRGWVWGLVMAGITILINIAMKFFESAPKIIK